MSRTVPKKANKVVFHVAKGVSFCPDMLSKKRNVSKERERYIVSVSARALSLLTA